MEARISSLPFLKYAAHYWGVHVYDLKDEMRFAPLLTKLLSESALRSGSLQALNYRSGVNDPTLAQSMFETFPTTKTQCI